MILAIDMGNSNIKIGIVGENDYVNEERLTTAYEKTSLEYASDIMSVLDFHDLKKKDISGAIISSVVPPLTGIVTTAVRKVLNLEPMIVSSDMKMDIALSKFKYPKGIGADLIVGAQAAFKEYSTPCIVINMGTATTVTVVDSDGEFLGGSIMPGMKQSANSLASSTAILPEIDLDKPGRVISRDTVQCMRSGIVYGIAGGIDTIIEKAEQELGKKCNVVACGGMARFAIPYCKRSIIIDEKLLMKGLMRLYELNKDSFNKECRA